MMRKERQLKRKHFLIAKCVRGRGNYPRSSSQIVFLPFILVVFTLLASCTGTYLSGGALVHRTRDGEVVGRKAPRRSHSEFVPDLGRIISDLVYYTPRLS